jgi:hypothetical protein
VYQVFETKSLFNFAQSFMNSGTSGAASPAIPKREKELPRYPSEFASVTQNRQAPPDGKQQGDSGNRNHHTHYNPAAAIRE